MKAYRPNRDFVAVKLQAFSAAAKSFSNESSTTSRAKEALELILSIEENDSGEAADEKSQTSQSEIDCHPSTAVDSSCSEFEGDNSEEETVTSHEAPSYLSSKYVINGFWERMKHDQPSLGERVGLRLMEPYKGKDRNV